MPTMSAVFDLDSVHSDGGADSVPLALNRAVNVCWLVGGGGFVDWFDSVLFCWDGLTSTINNSATFTHRVSLVTVLSSVGCQIASADLGESWWRSSSHA